MIYLHILKWDGDTVRLPALPKQVVKSSLLSGGRVKVDQSGSELLVTVAPPDRQASATVVKLELAGSAMDLAPMVTPRNAPPGKR